MSLRKKIQQDINLALKEKNKEKLLLLRYLLAQIKDEEIGNLRQELKDEQIIKLISRQIKKLEESLTLFVKAKRDDLINKTKKEIKILKTYLPQQLTDIKLKEEVEKIVKKNINISNPGQLIGVAVKILAGKADNKRIANTVLKELRKKKT